MGDYPWFRLWSDTLADRKLKRAARSLELPKATVLGAWTITLCLANDSPERGKLMVGVSDWLSAEEIEDELELGAEVGAALLSAFVSLGLLHCHNLGYEVANWDKRQFRSDGKSTARVRRHREKKAAESAKSKNKKQIQIQSETFHETQEGNNNETFHNDEVELPESAPLQAMTTALAETVKDPLWEPTYEEFNAAAYLLIGYDANPDQVRGFSDYWRKAHRQAVKDGRSYPYAGKPALKSLLQEWDSYRTAANAGANGRDPNAWLDEIEIATFEEVEG